ncbi:MAG TPA: radical SAM family heme chaperone HemW, partial [Terriglobales bacterium]|nr:radical SAM family heme chaperone HemW [Terriglobales bacterium]
MPLGLYISVPFCKSKCSYCNFASDVFAGGRMQGYVDRLCADIAAAEAIAIEAGGKFEPEVDSIYFGGGTPSLLEPAQLQQIFAAIRERFDVAHDGEITVECAPGTLSDAVIDVLARGGVNRVSLGVLSFVDAEARAVGRLHTREVALADIARLRRAGIGNINVDLIAGLPHQTATSWETSLDEVISSGVPHASVYMLEVDEDSRLGRELIAGGARYHAHFVPDDGLTAELYERACERLSATGIVQYEISNFARPGKESRHNLKYWTRQPYLGFGVDAHSMLRSASPEFDAVRLAMP